MVEIKILYKEICEVLTVWIDESGDGLLVD